LTIARQHHFLPECYLKGFTRGGGQLFALDLKKREFYFASPKKLGKQRDFNRVDADGLDPDALEKALAKFEGQLAPALKRVCSGQSLSDNDWGFVLNLISVIAARNPNFRKNFRDFKSRIIEMISEMHVSSPEIYESSIAAAKRDGFVADEANVSYEDMREFVKGKRYTLEFPHGADTVAEFEAQDTVLQLLGERKWMFIAAPPGSPGFVTCDHPVCLSHDDPQIRHPPGHGLRGTVLVFPVCRRLVVIGSFEGEGGRKLATESFVERINMHIASFASRHVFASGNEVRFAAGEKGTVAGAEVFDVILPINDQARP
jgi:hypothetical protein